MQLQGRRRPQASITNSPSSYFETSTRSCRLGRLVARMQTPGSPRATWRGPYRMARGSISHERSHGEGDHPIPFRTRQLSPSSPKVLRFRPREDRALRSWGMLSLFLHPGGRREAPPSCFGGVVSIFIRDVHPHGHFFPQDNWGMCPHAIERRSCKHPRQRDHVDKNCGVGGHACERPG